MSITGKTSQSLICWISLHPPSQPIPQFEINNRDKSPMITLEPEVQQTPSSTLTSPHRFHAIPSISKNGVMTCDSHQLSVGGSLFLSESEILGTPPHPTFSLYYFQTNPYWVFLSESIHLCFPRLILGDFSAGFSPYLFGVFACWKRVSPATTNLIFLLLIFSINSSQDYFQEHCLSSGLFPTSGTMVLFTMIPYHIYLWYRWGRDMGLCK